MTTYRALALGKVNLCLFVGERNSTGLHELTSLVIPLSVADEMILEMSPGSTSAQDEVVCPGVSGPNLASKALALYRQHTGWDGPSVRLTINKKIPVAAGMGGGSSDAATALRLIDFAAGHARPVLDEIAPLLGSDVAALLHWQPTLITQTGDQVEQLLIKQRLAFVVVPAEGQLSTAAVYEEFDRGSRPRPPAELKDLAEAVRRAVHGDEIPDHLLRNDLAEAATKLFPDLVKTLNLVRTAGAEHALVAGSGPTVFGIFTGADAELGASRCADELRRQGVSAIPTVPATEQLAQITCSQSS